jgi:hypothetical protein
MSYEPTLIIRKKDLDKALPILEEEQYSADEEKERVAKYLLQVAKYETKKFDDLELVLCSPEFTSFNRLVRERLTELNVDFREDW